MRVTRYIVPQIAAWLLALSGVATIGIAVMVYSGPEHRETATEIAREFFHWVWRGSRSRQAGVSAAPSPAAEGGVIQ